MKTQKEHHITTQNHNAKQEHCIHNKQKQTVTKVHQPTYQGRQMKKDQKTKSNLKTLQQQPNLTQPRVSTNHHFEGTCTWT